jgi:F-type H+-transporting ATPase subunit b
MRFATKYALWCAVLTASFSLLARPCAAQDEKGKADTKAVAEDHGDAKAGETPHAADAHGESGDPNPLGFDPDLAIFTVIVFGLLFLVLSLFAWPQISAALLEREKKIEDQIAAATAKHEEAKRVLAQHEAKLASAAGEVRALLDEAKRDADQTRKRIESEGRQAAQDELARAVREIERARDGAIEQLAKTSANVAVDLALWLARWCRSESRRMNIRH